MFGQQPSTRVYTTSVFPLRIKSDLEKSSEKQIQNEAIGSPVEPQLEEPENFELSEEQDCDNQIAEEQPLWKTQLEISSEKQVSKMAADIDSIDSVEPILPTCQPSAEPIPDLVESEKSEVDPKLSKILDRTRTRFNSERKPSYDVHISEYSKTVSKLVNQSDSKIFCSFLSEG